jgi:restriction system protein
VKALYADVLHEKAASGLLVTTSSLSPGARKVCEARSYPVKEADRKTIQRWLEEMRKPGAGVIS